MGKIQKIREQKRIETQFQEGLKTKKKKKTFTDLDIKETMI